jgi:protein MPE1
MSSWVHFKFKSSKEPTRINFDGTGLTVFELKREIITTSHLGDGNDFDLLIYDESSNEEYTDDTAIIPRSSMVIARRVPAARPGHGRAARYVSGRMPVHARRDQGTTGANALAAMNNAKTEKEKIAAMFAAEGDQWMKQQQEMSHQQKVPFGKGQKRPTNQPERPLPPGYICHRCQQKGKHLRKLVINIC